MLDAIDSFVQYAASRLATINPARKMAGVMEAQDWPPEVIPFDVDGASPLYLLDLGSNPISRDTYSAEIAVLDHLLQWTWLVQGKDLQQGQIGANRGARYRTGETIKEEILYILFPGWTEKKHWTLVPNTQNVQGASLTPPEWMYWSPARFMMRMDRKSGNTYGTAQIRLTDFEQPILS